MTQQPQLVPQSPQTFQPVPQPPQPVPQSSTQPPHSSTWADKVDAEQSGRSMPKMVSTKWAYSDRICDPAHRSQPLNYPPPLMPTPVSQPMNIHQSRSGVPTVPPPRPQPPFPQPPPYGRPTLTDNYPSPRRRPGLRRTRITPYTHCQFRPHSRLLSIRPAH